MSGYQFPYAPPAQGAPYSQFQQIQQMFPQPQGSVYSINAPLDIGNVPIGSTGLSVALCLDENLMYIKSFQNGNPVIMAYEVKPYTPAHASNFSTAANDVPQETTDARLDRLEKAINQLTAKQGGKFDELLQP